MRAVKKNFPKLLSFRLFFFAKTAAKLRRAGIAEIILEVFFSFDREAAVFNFGLFGG